MLHPPPLFAFYMLVLFCSGRVTLSAKPIIQLHDTVAINSQNQYALTLWSSNPDSLIIMSKNTLDHSNKIGYTIGKIDAYRNLGAGYYEKGEYSKSITNYEEAIKLAKTYGDPAKESQSMSNISKSLIALGSHHEALDYLYKALAIADNINKKEVKAHVLHNMGMVYHYQQKDKEAIDYYKRSRSSYEAIGDTSKTTFILGNIAHLYLKNKQYKQAETYYILSLQLARQYKNNKAIGNALISLGNFNSIRNQEHIAIAYYLQAKKILEELGEKTEYLRLLTNLATSYQKQEQYNKAFHYAKLNYQLASEQQQIYYISSSSKLLSELYEKIGKPQLALDYYKKFNRAQDSLYSTSNKEELVRLKERYTFEKRQQQIDDAYLKHLNKKEMYIHIACLAVISLIIIAFLLLFYIKQKKQANRTLQHAKIAMEKQNIVLKKTNDFKQQLLSLLAHDIRTPIANVKMILLLLDKTNLPEKKINYMIRSSQIEIDALILFVENLLLWITLQLSEKKIVKKYFPLEEIIAETFSLFRTQAENKGIKLSMQIDIHQEVFADIEALKIVIRNLVNNAIKFCGDGDLVKVSSEWDETGGQTLIRIADTGIGMSAIDLDRIFNNLGHSYDGTRHEKGTGIGLQLCIQYISLNDSKLFVRSSPQQGTEFWFNLKGRKSLTPPL